MSTQVSTLLSSWQAAWKRFAATPAPLRFAAVALVPLAFAGLFVGAIGQGTGNGRIPVAIVNQDTLQVMTAADGSRQNVFAGRQLVTELTGSPGFDWTITHEKDAAAALKSGTVSAILTVPANFSSSILSLGGATPQKADLSIRTDDAHSYLTGSVAQVVGTAMANTFGKVITAQYIGGLYTSLGDLGKSLTAAANGASQLSAGAGSLSAGLQQYTDGVSSLSYGLGQLRTGSAGLSQLSSGVGGYTSGVSQLSSTLSSLNPALQAQLSDPSLKSGLQAIVDGLAQTSAGGPGLAAQAASGISGVQSGIAQSADGAWQLASGSSALRSGADSLVVGADGLSAGLRTGAAQVPTTTAASAAMAAKIAADPVSVSVTTDNRIGQVGQAVATFFIPLGLWIGALAVFLVLRPVTPRALSSTARNGRLVASALGRAGLVTGIQALLLVALLHGALGVGWNLLPATIGFSLLMAIAFTAFHYLLTVGLGRAGLVVSLFALAVQVTSTGGIYPIELLSSPFQVVSPFLPLSYAVGGMQGILSGGNPGGVLASALTLAGFGVGSIILALIAVGRTRRARALGLIARAG